MHENAFEDCVNLNRIEISPNLELEIISEYAFSNTKITEFTIPEKFTCISYKSFTNCRIKNLNFSGNSKVKVIDEMPFHESDIETITIPSNVVKLKDKWCSFTYSLENVIIDENNQMFKNYDDKNVIGKSDINKPEYDVLVFVSRNCYITNITIPPFIKKIAPCAFEFCAIQSIVIPSNKTEIGEYAFANCSQLIEFEFENNSKIITIKEEVFQDTRIESISFPKHVIGIDFNTKFCEELRIIEFEENSELKYFNIAVDPDIKMPIIMIPVDVSNRLFNF